MIDKKILSTLCPPLHRSRLSSKRFMQGLLKLIKEKIKEEQRPSIVNSLQAPVCDITSMTIMKFKFVLLAFLNLAVLTIVNTHRQCAHNCFRLKGRHTQTNEKRTKEKENTQVYTTALDSKPVFFLSDLPCIPPCAPYHFYTFAVKEFMPYSPLPQMCSNSIQEMVYIAPVEPSCTHILFMLKA